MVHSRDAEFDAADFYSLSFKDAPVPVFFQVGTAFVVPTDGQVYDPTDGVVPRQ
jgi:hypothetical protein